MFSDLYGSARVHATRWALFSCLETVAIAALIAAIVATSGNGGIIPYLVTADAETVQTAARVAPSDEARAQSEANKAVIAAEAHAFVRELMTIDPVMMVENHRKAASRMSNKATGEFKDFLTADSPYERLQKVPGLTRTVEPITVDASQNGIAFVFAQTNERVGAGEPIVKRWRVAIHYALNPMADPQGVHENPLGFVVTHFERVLEGER